MNQVRKKLRRGIDPRDDQLIACARASNIEQVSFGLVDLVQLQFIRDGFDAFLRRQHVIVASHDGDCLVFEPFGEMHYSDGDAALRVLQPLRKFKLYMAGRLYRCTCAGKLTIERTNNPISAGAMPSATSLRIQAAIPWISASAVGNVLISGSGR